MENTEVILKDYSDQEKGAYLGAIASMATADHEASEEEIEYILALADAAELSGQQKQAVATAAKEITGDELLKCLDMLKNSQLKYSLVTDLIRFAQADGSYSEEEKANIKKISDYLGLNQQQFSFLDQFVTKTAETPNVHEEINKPGFMNSVGLADSFKTSGLNMGSLTKGFLGVVGPMVLAGLVSRGLHGRNSGGMFGGGIGGSLGGGGWLDGSGGGIPGGMLGSGSGYGGGLGGGSGLGSLISVLSGGRGYSRTGGLLGRMIGL